MLHQTMVRIDESTGEPMAYFLTDAYNRVAGMEKPSFFCVFACITVLR